MSSENRRKYLIIDCSGFAYVDMMGVNSLKEVGVDVYGISYVPLRGCKSFNEWDRESCV